MQSSSVDGEQVPVAYTQVDVGQRHRGQELEDRLNRLLGRLRAPGAAVAPPRTASLHAPSNASNNARNIVNRAPAPAQVQSKPSQFPSQEEAPGASPESKDAYTPKERSMTPRVDEAKTTAQESPFAGTPRDVREDNSGLDASPSSNEHENGMHGTVKSLKNQREIDFTVKFVDKRRRSSSHKGN